MHATTLVTRTYTYHATSGNVLTEVTVGFSEDLAGTQVSRTQTVTYGYDASHRLTSVTGPSTERTEYEYWPSGNGVKSGLLRYVRRRTSGTTFLVTEYQTYTTLGHPTTIVAPEATTTLVWTGHRLDSTTTAGRTTSYAYDSAGRLSTTTLPSGLIVRNNYDTNGRIWAVDRYDSTSTHYDRTQYQFDAAGRRTQVSVRRVTTGGTLVSQAGLLAATYEDHGFLRTSTLGPQLPTTFTYDSNGSGDLDSLLRGDGDQELFVTDPRGREQTLTRYFTSTTTGTTTLGYTEPSGNQQGGTLPTTVTDAASRTRTYRYDDFDHLIRSTSPEYGTQWWEWINDRITRTKLNANLATVYTYDDLGRVTLMDNNNGSAVVGPDYSFSYQNTATSPTCGMAYSGTCTTNRVGRLARVGVETTLGVFDWFEYAYDATGRLRGELYPDGRETSYDYESTGGRLMRRRFPAVSGATVQNFARFDYDILANEQHREILTSIAHEYTPGTTAFNWAIEMQADAAGRVTRAQLLDQIAGFHAQRSFRTDGRVASTSVRYQTGALTMAFAMDRTYSYSSDGSSMGWSTGTTNDVARTLFYDMSNRLICATSVAGSTTCPTTNTAPFLEAFTYDATDSRLTYRDSTGTTTYAFNGVAMTQENPPGSYDRRQFYALTNGGNRTSDRDQTLANTTRTYTYDALQRLRRVSLPRPTSGSTYQTHLITIHYDHRARPYYVTVLNQSTGVEERNRYYYGLDDELITWIRTPNASVATTYEERQYVYIGDFAVGEMFRSWLSGSATRRTYYHALEPMGLELAAFEFEHPGGAVVTYNPLTVVQRWSGFGMRTFQSGTGTPLPTRFPGQLELRGSDVRLWNGASTVEFAHALYLNRWRVYDPRVGQYLQPDPAASDGRLLDASAFAYADGRPADEIDPTGRVGWVMCWCGRPARNLLECVAVCWGPDPSRQPAAPDEDPPQGADTEEWEECLRSWTWCQGRQRLRHLAGRRSGTDCNTCLHLCRRDGSWNTRRCGRPPPAPAPQRDCDPFSLPIPGPVPVPVPVPVF